MTGAVLLQFTVHRITITSVVTATMKAIMHHAPSEKRNNDINAAFEQLRLSEKTNRQPKLHSLS